MEAPISSSSALGAGEKQCERLRKHDLIFADRPHWRRVSQRGFRSKAGQAPRSLWATLGAPILPLTTPFSVALTRRGED
jgi:hypothetical protein